MLQKLDEILFDRHHNQYGRLLNEVIGSNCRSLLDVGCGSNSPLGLLSQRLEFTVGVDGHQPSIDQSRAKGIHDDYKNIGILSLAEHFEPSSFDCVLLSDVIEHLEKPDGFKLVKILETIASKKVIIFTPNGFLPQGEYDGNPYQKHVSGWDVNEMRSLGYKVYGVHGWKPLRGEFNLIVWRPTRFWEKISLLSQDVVREHPQHAYQILCVKDMRDSH